MTDRPKTWPEVAAYVVASRTRTANARTLINRMIVALLVLAAMVVAIVALALDKASLLQLCLGGGGAAVATAIVHRVKSRLASRRSLPVEEPFGAEAGDQDDGGPGDDADRAQDRDEKKSQAGGEETRGAVVEGAARSRRGRAGRRAIRQ